jgi:hypothetical protein
VVPGVLQDGRVTTGQSFVHKAFISTIFADAPFRATMLYFVGCFVAVLACAFCRLTGERKGPGSGVMRYLGYARPSACTAGPGAGRQFQMGVLDSERLYSSADMAQLADTAERARQQGGDVVALTAFHGATPLLRHLPYQDVRTVSVVPFMHTFCQGVLKDFIKAVFVSPKKPQPQRQPLAAPQGQPQGMAGSGLQRRTRQAGQTQQEASGSQQPARKRQRQAGSGAQAATAAAAAAAAAGAAADPQPPPPPQQQQQEKHGPEFVLAPDQRVSFAMRKVIAARTAGFQGGLHPQKNRPVRDPAKYGASHTFEEMADGIRGIFSHLFWPVIGQGGQVQHVLPSAAVREAFGCLRAFGHFHLTGHSWDSQAEFAADVAAAEAKMLRFASLAEQVRDRLCNSLQPGGVDSRAVVSLTLLSCCHRCRTLWRASRRSSATAACAPATCTGASARSAGKRCTGATRSSGWRIGWSGAWGCCHAARAAGWCATLPTWLCPLSLMLGACSKLHWQPAWKWRTATCSLTVSRLTLMPWCKRQLLPHSAVCSAGQSS